MKTLAQFWAGAILASACMTAAAAPTPPSGSLQFEPESEIPAEIFVGGDVRLVYRVRNTGTQPIRIQRIDPAPPPGAAHFEPAELAPGATGRVEFHKPAIDKLGKQSVVFYVYSDDALARSVPISLPVFASSAYSPESPAVDFGVVRKGHAEPKRIDITSFETPKLGMRRIIEKPDWLKIDTVPTASGDDPQRLSLTLSLTQDVPIGEIRRTIRIGTTLDAQPELELRVIANVYDKIQATPTQLDIAAIHRNAEITKTFEVRALDGKPIRITKLEETGENLELSSAPCGESCVRVIAKVKTGQLKPLRGHVTVQVGSHGETIKVPYYGLIVKEGTTVKNLGVLGADADIRVNGEIKEP